MSKAFGLAAIRLGCVINAGLIDALAKIIAPYPVPLPVMEIFTGVAGKQSCDNA